MKNFILCIVLALSSVGLMAQRGREEIPLNDSWQFKRGPFPSDNIAFVNSWSEKWVDVKIPHTWNDKDMTLKYNDFYAGPAFYRREYTPSEDQKNKRTFLRFQGVGSVAELYVNNTFVGRHKGAYGAFCIEITANLKYGEVNQIILRADNASREDVIPVNHSLFGVYGGIYRPVSLIITDKVNITPTDHASSGVFVRQGEVSAKNANVSIETRLDNATLQHAKIELENVIYDMSGRKIVASRRPISLTSQGVQKETDNLSIKNPRLWNGRQDPYLYKIETNVYQNGKLIDRVTSPLGLRKIELVAGKGLFLNGKQYPMYGVCRHQDRMGYGSALSNAQHAEDLADIMEIGATTVRFAHYQQSDYIYSKCDSLGLIIWAEIPFVNRVSTHEADNAKSQLSDMILQSFNHPSIYVWGLHNEVYSPSPYTAQLTKELHTLAKTLDPDRYTVSVSGYGHMEHPVNLQADIQGMNRYFGWYEGKIGDMEKWVTGLETKYPGNLLMLTEYGADANIDHQSELTGESYNWTTNYYPEGFATKTHERHWAIISKHPYILASYAWNMFDFAVPMWSRGGVAARNMKGLITFDRKIRKDSFFWYKANWSKEPVFYLTERRAVERQRKVTKITIYSNIGKPTVTLNGKRLDNVELGGTPVHYVVQNVTLDQGENIVVATAPDGTSDTIRWTFEKESDNVLINNVERKEVHVGF